MIVGACILYLNFQKDIDIQPKFNPRRIDISYVFPFIVFVEIPHDLRSIPTPQPGWYPIGIAANAMFAVALLIFVGALLERAKRWK